MGFSTSAVFIILFAAGVAVGAQLYTALDGYIYAISDASAEQSEAALSKVKTSIKIVNVSGDKIYVENRGKTTLDPDYISLAVDDVWLGSDKFSILGVGYFNETAVTKTKLVRGAYYNTTGWLTLTLRLTEGSSDAVGGTTDTIEGVAGWFNITVVEKSFNYTTTSPTKFYWLPKDVIAISTTVPIVNKTKVIVENRVWDEYYNYTGNIHYHLTPIEVFSKIESGACPK